MYGWRGRLGLILGLPNVVCEMECHDMAPDGVSVNGVRMNIHPIAIYNEPKVMEEIEQEVTRLSNEIKGVKADIVSTPKDDVIILKPNFYGIGVDLNALFRLWKEIFSKQKPKGCDLLMRQGKVRLITTSQFFMLILQSRIAII